MARKKCSRYLDTSNLDSSEDEETGETRKLRKRPKVVAHEPAEFSFGPLNSVGEAQDESETVTAPILQSDQPVLIPPPLPVIEIEFSAPSTSPVPHSPIVETPRRRNEARSTGVLGNNFTGNNDCDS